MIYFICLDAIGLDVDENVSKENFLKLNDFEVQEQDTTEHDLWTGLKSVGFNNALEIDMVSTDIYLYAI